MVQELEKLIEVIYYIPYNKDKSTFSLFNKSISTLHEIIEKNHFPKAKAYTSELNSINDIYKDDLSSAFTGDDDKIIHRKIQKKLTDLARTILNENKKIFIVHGRNTTILDRTTSLLGRLKLDYVVLQNEHNLGSTIIEKFLRNAEECRFAIVLFSADDLGQLNEPDEKLKPRTRQNVILELGYFLAKIGRKNIIILHQTGPQIERPSDFDGIVYEPFDEYGAWKSKVIKEMRKAGIYIDQNLADRA